MTTSVSFPGNYSDLLDAATFPYLDEIARRFDAARYLSLYPDVRRSRIDPLEHYLRHGWREGRQPNADFDIGTTGGGSYSMIPFVQSIVLSLAQPEPPTTPPIESSHEYKVISQALQESFYRQQLNGHDVQDCVQHYLESGSTQGLDPSPGFDTAFYLEKNKDISEAGINPFYHYLIQGKNENRLTRPSRKRALEDFRKAEAPAYSDDRHRCLLEAGLFDPEWYRRTYRGSSETPDQLLSHYVNEGEAAGNKPNCIFDPTLYVAINKVQAKAGALLLHYFESGESQGLLPCNYFLPDWYAKEYSTPAEESPLAHYIKNRDSNRFSPCPYFSPQYYLENNEDVRASGINAFDHWYQYGMREGRRGSTDFDEEHIWREYLAGDKKKNPLDWFITVGRPLGWTSTPDTTAPTVHEEIRRYTSEGDAYEDFHPAHIPLATGVKAVAFYLTQFHAIPENDAWWGKGFTEWRNVPRGVPRFQGHYQPRVPRDLGYYELEGTATMRKQVELAKAAGLHGFCFYYYNFAGHRLLEKPLDAFVDDQVIDFPFCLLWANENWTRRWDGHDNDVLMRQNYSDEYLPPLVDDLAKYLKHKNYMLAQGRPILFFYRADVIPETPTVLAQVRALFQERHDIDPLFLIAQAFGTVDPRPLGFDGALEFPPHKIGVIQSDAQTQIRLFDPNFKGKVIRYQEAIEFSLADQPTDFPLIKTAFPNWDNDARKQGSGMCFIDSSPSMFENWVDGIVRYAKTNPVFGEKFVFINAWNEWCEGAYLEPDCHYGHAYLNALSRSLAKAAGAGKGNHILLVGHDAFRAGAQQLLLSIGSYLKGVLKLNIEFILLSGGDMEGEYKAVAPLYVVDQRPDRWQSLSAHIQSKAHEGFSVAITNSVVTGSAIGGLKHAGLRCVSLVHELPTIIKEYGIHENWRAIRDQADVVVFPNRYVQGELTTSDGNPKNISEIRPQGIYKKLAYKGGERELLRQKLGIPADAAVVVNLGYADYRKGLDLFVLVADRLTEKKANTHFVWVGTLNEQLGNWVRRDVARRGLKNIHFLPFDPNVSTYLFGADAFLLTSREDPFPSVVLEAVSAGLPVICFDWGGGYSDFISSNQNFGRLAKYLDIDDMAAKLKEVLKSKTLNSADSRNSRMSAAAEQYSFGRYCLDLVSFAFPHWQKVGVVVPNYNYARFLPARLESIRHQSCPVRQMVILDDASQDDSCTIIDQAQQDDPCRVSVVVNRQNSGNVFRQWRKGVELVTTEFVWIAEADDSALPAMVERLASALALCPDAHFAFCDSSSIDANGQQCYESYKGYYATLGDEGLLSDGVFSAADFAKRFLSVKNMILNASSVIWRRSSLLAALDSVQDTVFGMRCAGDWLIYLAACAARGSVCYVADPLNVHRRHGSSVTHAQARPEQIAEIRRAQEYFRSVFDADSATCSRQENYLSEIRLQFGVAQ